MKKKLLFLLVCNLITVWGFAQSGECGDNLTWNFNSLTGTLTISGIGEMKDFRGGAPWFDIRSQITQIEIGDDVTSIGSYAFRECRNFTSIDISKNITNIGIRAFEYCLSLTSINVESENPSFMSENNVLFNKTKTILICCPIKKSGSYMIPTGVVRIEDYAFLDCSNLTNITIPNSVMNIGIYAFFNCSSLTSIIVPNSVTSIGDYAFYRCSNLFFVTIPESVINIGQYAFDNIPWYYNLPDGIVYINNVLYKYKGIMPDNTIIDVRDGTVNITDHAFDYCSGLTSITIPNSVTSIGNGVFWNCTNLSSITMGNSISSIGIAAFGYCQSLISIINLNPVPITIISDVFFTIDKSTCVLKVPFGSAELYQQTDEWREFSQIAEMDETNIKKQETNSIEIFPNPVSENFVINGIERSIFITISDLNGKIVLQQTVSKNESISVKQLPQGLYFVLVKGKIIKIIKQ